MKKEYIVGLIVLIGLLLIAGTFLSKGDSTQQNDSTSFSITTSFYPIAFLAQEIAGEYAHVTNVVPAGAEPHEFEPTARELSALYETDLFLYNGGGIDSWADSISHELEEEGVPTIEMSAHMPNLLEPPAGHSHGHEDEHEDDDHGDDDDHEEDEDDHHEDETFDEHFWLDPNLAIIEAEVIRDTLVELDPTNAEAYSENTDTLIASLQALDAQYTQALDQCSIRAAVTSHAAFGYLANRYDFEMIAIAGVSPHDEPSVGTLAEIAEEAEEWGVSYVLFETLVSPKLAETLAQEIGADTLVFNPLEGLTQEQIDNNESYITVMQDNLDSLTTAMECQ